MASAIAEALRAGAGREAVSQILAQIGPQYLTSAFLNQIIGNIPLPPTFLRKVFFPTEEAWPSNRVSCEFRRGLQSLAPFVTEKRPGLILAQPAYSAKIFTPPLIKPARFLDGDRVLEFWQTSQFQAMSIAERLHFLLARDLQELDNSVTRRIEWMVAQLLFTGQIPLQEPSGQSLGTISFAPINQTTLSGASLWSAANTTPLVDIDNARLAVAQRGLPKPNLVVFSSGAADLFRANASVQAAYERRFLHIDDVNDQPDLSDVPGASFMGQWRSASLIEYDATYLADDGTLQFMLPANTVLIANGGLGIVNYAANRVIDADGSDNYIQAPRVVQITPDQDAGERKLTEISRPLPVPYDTGAWEILTVC